MQLPFILLVLRTDAAYEMRERNPLAHPSFPSSPSTNLTLATLSVCIYLVHYRESIPPLPSLFPPPLPNATPDNQPKYVSPVEPVEPGIPPLMFIF